MKYKRYVGITILVILGGVLFLYVKALEKRNFDSKCYKLGVSFFNFNTVELLGDKDLIRHFRLECKDEDIERNQVLIHEGKILSNPRSFKGSTVLYAYYNDCLLGNACITKVQDWWSFDYKFHLYEENDSIRCDFRVIGPEVYFMFNSTPCPIK